MRASELQRVLRRRPFIPIRLHISSGEHVDVTHPSLALVTKPLVVVGVGPDNGVADYATMYKVIHVVKIEPLNGRKRKTPRPQEMSIKHRANVRRRSCRAATPV